MIVLGYEHKITPYYVMNKNPAGTILSPIKLSKVHYHKSLSEQTNF